MDAHFFDEAQLQDLNNDDVGEEKDVKAVEIEEIHVAT